MLTSKPYPHGDTQINKKPELTGQEVRSVVINIVSVSLFRSGQPGNERIASAYSYSSL